jgi:hypothetical protein
MKCRHLSTTILLKLVVASSCLAVPLSLPAQTPQAKWERVYTGDESVIDIDRASLELEPHIMRADFRTVLSRAENLRGTEGTKYKSLLETYEFKLNENRYRVSETTWLDAKGGILRTNNVPTDWRVMRAGGVVEKILNAAGHLPPFGVWKVVTYRFAEDGPKTVASEPDLAKLVGTRVRLQAEQATVSNKACAAITYEDKLVTKDEFVRTLGVSLESQGINASSTETVRLICEQGNWRPPQSLVIKIDKENALMLWEGVFLVLKRERESTGIALPQLKRRPN